MTDHNNYDVTELFYRGWIHMVPRQCQVASAAVNEMTNWWLGGSVKDDGSLVSPDKSDPIPDSFYYAASFLDTIGYFNKKSAFGPPESRPGNATKIRTGMIAQLKIFNHITPKSTTRWFDSARPSILGPTRSFSANPCGQAPPPGDFGKFKPC
jgi:hypothetical protein